MNALLAVTKEMIANQGVYNLLLALEALGDRGSLGWAEVSWPGAHCGWLWFYVGGSEFSFRDGARQTNGSAQTGNIASTNDYSINYSYDTLNL